MTGISDGDVEGAPRFSEVLPQLRRFIGAAPVLGHNVRFDLNFLSLNGLSLQNPVIDTYALAPTYDEIGAEFGINKVTVLAHLKHLEAKGVIRRVPYAARGIEICDKEEKKIPVDFPGKLSMTLWAVLQGMNGGRGPYRSSNSLKGLVES